MNWKITYSNNKSKVNVWVKAETREEADLKALEIQDVQHLMAQEKYYSKTIISEESIIEERQKIYNKGISKNVEP